MSDSAVDVKHVTMLTFVTVPGGKMMEVMTLISDLHAIAKEGTTECIHYSWAMTDDQVMCRQAYTNLDGYLQHVADTKSKMELIVQLVGGPEALKNYAVGPSEELEKFKPALDAAGFVCYNLVDGAFLLNDYFGLSGVPESVKEMALEQGAEAATMDKHITMTSKVSVDDETLEKLKAIFPKLYEARKNGTKDCIYFDIATVTKGPNSHEVMFMDAWATIEGFMQHMQDAGEPIQAMAACVPDGLLDEFHFVGSSEQVAQLKPVFPAFARPGKNFWWQNQNGAFLPFLRSKLPNKKVGIHALSIFTFQPEHVDEIRDLVADEEGLRRTKAFKGNTFLDAQISKEEPNKLYMWQKWESEEDRQAYIAWRGTTEFMGKLASKFSEMPQIIDFSKAKF